MKLSASQRVILHALAIPGNAITGGMSYTLSDNYQCKTFNTLRMAADHKKVTKSEIARLLGRDLIGPAFDSNQRLEYRITAKGCKAIGIKVLQVSLEEENIGGGGMNA